MLGHIQRVLFDAAAPTISKPFNISGDTKAFGGSVYMPGATTAKLEYSIDQGVTWIGPAVALNVAAAGYFVWTGTYFTMGWARVVATAGTPTDCRVFTID